MRLGQLVLYAQDVDATVGFYEKHFAFKALRQQDDRMSSSSPRTAVPVS